MENLEGDLELGMSGVSLFTQKKMQQNYVDSEGSQEFRLDKHGTEPAENKNLYKIEQVNVQVGVVCQ